MGYKTGHTRNPHIARPAPIVIDVQEVTNFAHFAGLNVERAQQILLESAQWRYPDMRCSMECGTQPHVVVDHGWADRTVLYCTNCRVADLWIG